jgi:RNA recognition motif-containing protein
MASKLFVGGLPYAVTSEDLNEQFGRAEPVVSATVIADRVTGQSWGFGFVEMSTEAEAREVIAQLNGQTRQGRRLTVNVANPPGPRSAVSREPRSGGALGAEQRRTGRW